MSQANESPRGAVLSLREAAAATGVSYSTIKRRQPDFTHAYRDKSGTWKVPVSDLLGAGLKLRGSSAEPVSQAHEPPMNGAELAQARAEIQELTAKLSDERQRRLVAEAIAAERGASLERLDLALRAIAGPPRPPEPVQEAEPAPVVYNVAHTPRRAAPEPAEAAPEPARRGLWARLRGA